MKISKEKLQAGRQQARIAVLMQALAEYARINPNRAQYWLKRSDQAAFDARAEDFVVAKVN